MSGTIVVLMPNGRRQSVKVTPNTTILHVLEEACYKQGFPPEVYNLKHHRTVLDVSQTIRFAGLPNNCLLELIEADKIRADEIVTVGVQTEDGNRVMGEFSSLVTVRDVLEELCPSELSTNTVVIYLRFEIYGSELDNKTMKSLGITSGRAMLRVIHRTPNELKNQANVSAPLPVKPVEEKPYKRQFQKVESNPRPPPQPQSQTHYQEKPERDSARSIQTSPVEDPPKPSKVVKADDIFDKIRQEKRKQTDGLKVKSHPAANAQTQSKATKSSRERAKEDFIFLGSRNAMLFSYETAKVLSQEELPDDFFELSITDVKRLFRDIKARSQALDTAPLMTSAMRKLEATKQQLNALNIYKKAVIRVQFPNRMVLQGVFKPSESIQDVIDFVREYIEHKSLKFYLFTTPPKEILETNLKLLECNCVPGALLHFGCEEKLENYLRPDILDKVTSNLSATEAASQIRMANSRMIRKEPEEEVDISQYFSAAQASASRATMDYKSVSRTSPEKTEKLPKWFKPSK